MDITKLKADHRVEIEKLKVEHRVEIEKLQTIVYEPMSPDPRSTRERFEKHNKYYLDKVTQLRYKTADYEDWLDHFK